MLKYIPEGNKVDIYHVSIRHKYTVLKTENIICVFILKTLLYLYELKGMIHFYKCNYQLL